MECQTSVKSSFPPLLVQLLALLTRTQLTEAEYRILQLVENNCANALPSAREIVRRMPDLYANRLC